MPRDTIFARRQSAVGQTVTLPAPVGGLNARDSLAQMEPNQAVNMLNLYPLQYGVRIRKGYQQWADDFIANTDLPVETLMTYHGIDGTEKMFAATGQAFYDVTTNNIGGSGKLAVHAGNSNARWQWVNVTNQFGSFIIAVNGADTPLYYDGTAWAALAITANATDYPNFDPKDFINVVISHRRLWFVQKDSGDAWYLPVDQIQGEVSRFGVGEVFPRGGYLQAINTWSTESGGGMVDNTVFVSSEGDVALFSGYDPDDIITFQLAGTYQIGATFNRRCLVKYGSDLWLLCEDGIYPMSALLSQSKVLMAGAVTDIIQLRLSEDVTAYNKNFGWEMMVVNRHQLVMLNVPVSGEGNRQYVMNQVTHAWTQFKGYDARCFGLLNNEPYYGGVGKVYQAWYGNLDNFTAADGGDSITGYCQQAFSPFGPPGLQKRWTMIRPVFNAAGYPGVNISVNTDYELDAGTLAEPPAYVQGAGSVWDTAVWDGGKWGGGLVNAHNWYSVDRVGFCASPIMKMQSSFDTFWITTDVVSEKGGVL